MTPEKRIDEAIRLMKAIDQRHRDAVAYVELYRHPLFDNEYLKRFDNTYSAHSVTTIGYALHASAVICVAGLWDQGADARSLPNVLRRLDAPGVEEELVRRNRTSTAEVFKIADGHYLVDEAETKTRRWFVDIYEKAKEKHFVGVRDRIVNLRHKIAHSLEVTRAEERAAKAGVALAPTKWGDLEIVLKTTEEIIHALHLVLTETDVAIDGSHNIWARYAASFWNSISDPK